jgi:hypothetical protein
MYEVAMSDAELMAEHIRAIEMLLIGGVLTESDKTVARVRLMVIVGKLRQSAGDRRSDPQGRGE